MISNCQGQFIPHLRSPSSHLSIRPPHVLRPRSPVCSIPRSASIEKSGVSGPSPGPKRHLGGRECFGRSGVSEFRKGHV